MAYCAKNFDKSSYRTYCLMGDGESMEGNVWEALNFAGFYKLDNLCAIIDINRLGQSDPAPLAHDLDQYRRRLNSFGFNTVVVDGHDVEELCKAFHTAETTKGMPTAILAKTFKGRDFPEIEDQMNWHGKPLGDKAESVLAHLNNLIKNPTAGRPSICSPANDVPDVTLAGATLAGPPAYNLGDKVATRQAYGNALAKLAQGHNRVVALAMFQSLPWCTVFFPTDAVAMERAVELAANTRGITFLRASRPALPVIYGNDEQFQT